jgi:hypothetical protein
MPGPYLTGRELFSTSRASPRALSQREDATKIDPHRDRPRLRDGLERDTGHPAFARLCDLSEPAAGRVEDFSKLPQDRTEMKGLALWVDGKVSDRATQELKNRKIDLATGVLDQH